MKMTTESNLLGSKSRHNGYKKPIKYGWKDLRTHSGITGCSFLPASAFGGMGVKTFQSNIGFWNPSKVMTDQVLSEAYKCDLPGVSPEVRDPLLQFSNNPSGGEISANLERRIVTAGQISAPFEMDDAMRTALIRGCDDTMDSLSYASTICEFEDGLD